MARNRVINTSFWEDEKVGHLSLGARLLFIGMWNCSDDEGLLRFNASYLKAQVFIYDDEISNETVEIYMQELEDLEMVKVYQAGLNNQKYCHITNFLKYQKIDKPTPSKLPKPPFSINNKKEKSIDKQEKFVNSSSHSASNSSSHSANDSRRIEVKRSKEKLKEVKEKELLKEEQNDFDNSSKQNDTATANDNGQNCDDNATPLAVPQEFKPLVDYLTAQGYSNDKARLVANLRQSINWTLTSEHVKIFIDQSEDEIKKSFEILSKTFKKRDKSAGFTTFADSKV